MTKGKLEKARSREIFQSNSLIQKGRYKYTNQEQKLILYICSKLQPKQKNTECLIELSEFMRVCGIESDGRAYERTRKTLESLQKKAWWVPIEDELGKGETLVSFINRVNLYEKSGKIKLFLEPWVMPEMLEVKEKFTKYELYNILALSGEYSIPLYENFKSRQMLGKWIVDVEELKHLLCIDEYKLYKKWAEVKRKILDISIKQINEYTDLSIVYMDNGGRGRKATRVCFVINSKEPMERLMTKMKVDECLDEKVVEVIEEPQIDAEFEDFVNTNTANYKIPRKHKKIEIDE